MSSFDELEASNQDGKPIELYEFSQGSPPQRGWYYNSSDRPLFFDNGDGGGGFPHVYLPLPIKTNGITLAGGSPQDEVEIVLPVDADVSALYNAVAPSVRVDVRLRRTHWDNIFEAPLYWIGFVTARTISNVGEATLQCNTLIAGLAQAGLRLGYTRQCPYALYDINTCKAVKNPVTCVITALTGNSFEAAALSGFADHALDGGFVEWVIVGSLKETRAIASNVGGAATILGSTYGMEIGMTVDVLIGCGHDRASCNTDHDNLPNYGGFAHMPGKSPFDGTPVF